MKYLLAKRLYDSTEAEIKLSNPNIGYIKRAALIFYVLEKRHGKDMADEILDSVFENEIN